MSRGSWASVVIVILLAGCDDYPTMLRDKLALATERADMWVKVVDEASAKEVGIWEQNVSRRDQKINENNNKYIGEFDKKERSNWIELEKRATECITNDEYPEPSTFSGLQMGDAYYLATRERIAHRRTLRRQLARLKNVLADLVEKKRQELIEAGETNPVVNAETTFPALYALTQTKLE